MAIDFNTGLRALQTYGEEATREQQLVLERQRAQIAQQRAAQDQYAFNRTQQQDQSRVTLAQQARGGDYAGAQREAALGGDFDFARALGGLREDQLGQFQREIDTIGTLHPQLKALPPEQRAAVAAPILAQAGFTPEEIANNDWSDAGLDAQYELSARGKAALAARMKAAEPYTLAPGSRRYSGDGIIAENPAEPKYQAVPEGGMLVRVDGGSATPVYGAPSGGSAPASGGGEAVTGRTQYGWTPRARNGGDNTDAAVDGKIAGMAQALRVPADGDISGLDPMTIARALTLSEGGRGSLADRNNNPGNLTDPRTGGYRKFGSKEEGLRAAAAQVRRNLARGQTTIRTMVEGLPAGGQRQQSGTPSVIMGRPKQTAAPSGYRYSGDRLEPIPGGPADRSEQGASPETRKSEGSLRKEFDSLPEVKTFKKARTQFQALRSLALNPKATAQDDIAVIFSFMKSLDAESTVREGEFATAQNAGGVSDTVRNAYNKALSGERLNPTQRKNMVRAAYQSYKAYRDAYNQTAESYRGYARDASANPDRVARTYTPDKPQPKADRMSQFKIVRVR